MVTSHCGTDQKYLVHKKMGFTISFTFLFFVFVFFLATGGVFFAVGGYRLQFVGAFQVHLIRFN